MTLVRLSDGSIWVHSPIALTNKLQDELQALGSVSYVVAPNKFHHLYFSQFLEKYPAARGYIAHGLGDKVPALAKFPIIPEKTPWEAEIQGRHIGGLPLLNETVWFHEATGTLIVTDLLFCIAGKDSALTRAVATILGVNNQVAMSRTMRWSIKHRRDFADSIRHLLELPVRRIILAHDQIIEEDAGGQLRSAFAWLL